MIRRQHGFTLVETLIVLAVIIAIVGIIAALSMTARGQGDSNSFLQMMMTVEANIRSNYASRQDYTGLNTNEAVSLGVVPRGMATVVTGGGGSGGFGAGAGTFVATHPLGGGFGVGPSAYVNASTNAANAGFYIKASGLSREACIALLVQTSPNYQGIVVDTSAVDPAVDNTQTTAFSPRRVIARGTQVSAAVAQTWCSHATSNTIRWETS